LIGARIAPQENGRSNDAVVSNEGHFDCRSVLDGVNQGNNGIGQKVDTFNQLVTFENDLTEGQSNRAQVWQERITVRGSEGT
jgi:hypothetical protein